MEEYYTGKLPHAIIEILSYRGHFTALGLLTLLNAAAVFLAQSKHETHSYTTPLLP
jgi:hypothetical protein